jgi:enterochelin esterase family protein
MMNKFLSNNTFLLAVVLVVSQNLFSQVPGKAILSPEVHSDKSVTFRYYAPFAKQVKLEGLMLKEPQLMTREQDGTWIIKFDRIKPDIYPYCFVVDSIQIMDPNNIMSQPSEDFKYSLVDIPGKTPLIHSMQDVPHGEITYCYYNSKTVGFTRPMVVYTPPCYTQNTSEKYPVLYLIHGSTDTEETWFKVGRVNLILDNLIAQGKAKPMIIVMPYGNPFPQLDPFKNDSIVVQELIDDMIPYIEHKYRVIASQEQRAVAGFSRGGRRTLRAGILHSDLFAWACAFSPGINLDEYEKYFSNRSPDPVLLNKQLKLLWISCGKEDPRCEVATQFVDLLKRYSIKNETFFPSGDHTWMVSRLFIATVAPFLFK